MTVANTDNAMNVAELSLMFTGIEEEDVVSTAAMKLAIEAGVASAMGEPVENIALVQVGNTVMKKLRRLTGELNAIVQIRYDSSTNGEEIKTKAKAVPLSTFSANIRAEAALLGVGERFQTFTTEKLQVSQALAASATGAKADQPVGMSFTALGEEILIAMDGDKSETDSDGSDERNTLIGIIAGSVSCFVLMAALAIIYTCRNSKKRNNDGTTSMSIDLSIVTKPGSSMKVASVVVPNTGKADTDPDAVEVIQILPLEEVEAALKKYGVSEKTPTFSDLELTSTPK